MPPVDPPFDGDANEDTEICAFHSLGAVIDMLASTGRLLSLEVGALVGMELCERALEGALIDVEAVQIDVIGHLRVTRALHPSDGDLLSTLVSWEGALHPRGRSHFAQAHREAPGSLRIEELSLFLRDRFAALLFPIDRFSARTSLTGAIELAAREASMGTGERALPRPETARFDEESTARGIGPASVEHILSGLTDTVLGSRDRLADYGGPGGFEEFDFGEETTRFDVKDFVEVLGDEPESLEVDLLGPEVGDSPQRRVGRFAIFGRLGEGGMAEALLAKRVDGGPPFVLKRLLPEAAEDPALVRMFEDEARLGLFLDHPHIARVLEYVPGPRPAMMMEWAPGLTFARLMRRARRAGERVPIDVVLRVGEAIASALAYAHSARNADGRPLRVIHRDVSPQNVVLQWDGQVKLLDFGVARSAVQAEHSEAGVIKGKFAYMAPEQSLGMPLDDRADVFCVGICLYEALSGKRLFDSDERLAAVRALAEGPIPDVRQHRPEVQETLAKLVNRCLAADPGSRPHMDELHEEIAQLREEAGASRRSVVDLVRIHEPGWEDWRRALAPGQHAPSSDAPAPPSSAPAMAEPPVGPPGTVPAPAPFERLAPAETYRAPPLSGPPAGLGSELWRRGWPVLLMVAAFLVGAGAYAMIRTLASPPRAPHAIGDPPLTPSTPGLRGPGSPPALSPDTAPAQPESAPATAAAPDDEEAAPDDEEAAPDDEEAAPDDEEAAPDDEEAAPDDEEAAPDDEEAAPERERGTGTLLVRTRPAGARVTLDGVRLRGVTPQRWTIPAGAHRVRVFRAGHRPATRQIVTEADGGGLLDLRLRRR